MGKWKHVIKNGVCVHCNVPAILLSNGKRGNAFRCPIGKSNQNGRRPYALLLKKEVCSRCGFVPEHTSQLDIDHIDENHHNNDLANLRVLCANCHRLKSQLSKRKSLVIK